MISFGGGLSLPCVSRVTTDGLSGSILVVCRRLSLLGEGNRQTQELL